jgi:hypothetical protein
MTTLSQLTPGTIITLEFSYDVDGDGNRTLTEWRVLEQSPTLVRIQSNKGIGYLSIGDEGRISILRQADEAEAIEPEAIQAPKPEDVIEPADNFDIEERLQPKRVPAAPKKHTKGKK